MSTGTQRPKYANRFPDEGRRTDDESATVIRHPSSVKTVGVLQPGCTGSVVVVTGASGGIGAALAYRLGAQGHHLVLAARRAQELQQVAAQSGSRTLTVVTDVTQRRDVENLRDRALAEFGQVDVWINNAGRGIGKTVLELTDEDFDEMIAINTKSALYGMQAIVPHFQERGKGHLINVSSFLGRVPLRSYRSAYNAAKAALNALTANLRMDLRRAYPGIHVSLVMPGPVANDFARNALGGTPATSSTIELVKPQTADEVAAAIVSLLERPAPELYTNPPQADIARRYYDDVAAFEAHLGQAPVQSASDTEDQAPQPTS